jgi:hypothetical protein
MVTDVAERPRTEHAPEPRARRRRDRLDGYDAAIAVVLGAVALYLRWPGMPTDGVRFDDTIAAAGTYAPLSQFFTVNVDHPGYIAILRAVRLVSGDATEHMAYPALIAGVLGPVLLFLAFRWFTFERSIATLLGVAVAVSATHVMFSGRVRPYTIDTLVVLGVLAVVAPFARLHWRWSHAVVWCTGAIAVATLSGFALVAAGVAGIILVLHPRGDLKLRIVAVGIQGAAALGLFAITSNYDAEALQDEWTTKWDAFVHFDANPVTFGRDVLRHLGRIAHVYPGGPTGAVTVLLALVAVAGISWAALGRRRAMSIRGRFLALLLVVALCGSIAKQVPFGPTQDVPQSPGGRVTLWLIPVFGFGLAYVMHRARRGLAPYAKAFDVVVLVAAAAVLVGGWDRSPRYPTEGSATATRFVEQTLRPRDVVLITPTSFYDFMIETPFPASLREVDEKVPFVPDFADQRLQLVDSDTTPDDVMTMIGDAPRVVVAVARPGAADIRRARVNQTLQAAGYTPEPHEFGTARVVVWNR